MHPPQSQMPGSCELEIRPCLGCDLPLLEWDGAYAEHRRIIDDTFMRQQAGAALMLVAVAADFPVAQVWLDFERPPCRDTALLWALRTYPPMRGRGIGGRLVRRAEASVLDRDRTAVELGVEKGNRRALRFYQRLGYARIGELVETCRYEAPDGEKREWIVDQWQLRRELRRPAACGSGCDGPSATSRRGASKG